VKTWTLPMGCYLDYCFCYLCSFVFQLPLVDVDYAVVVVDDGGVDGASGYP